MDLRPDTRSSIATVTAVSDAPDVPAGRVEAPLKLGWTWLRLALLGAWVLLLVGATATGEPAPDQPAPGLVSTVWGLRVPAWLGALALVSAAVSLFSLVRGPEPWRATRWAWFWLMSNPLGLSAYLLLAGPTPGIARPSPGGSRLRGGWAFLISSVIGTALANLGLR